MPTDPDTSAQTAKELTLKVLDIYKTPLAPSGAGGLMDATKVGEAVGQLYRSILKTITTG